MARRGRGREDRRTSPGTEKLRGKLPHLQALRGGRDQWNVGGDLPDDIRDEQRRRTAESAATGLLKGASMSPLPGALQKMVSRKKKAKSS